MFNQIQFGKRLQRLRKGRGITQKEAAECLHISTNHLAKIEVGLGAPSIDLCVDMSMYFGVSLDYLIVGDKTEQEAYKRVIREAVQILLSVEKQFEGQDD